ncbi:MAG: hypothetical protein GY717_17800 [Rhodobacteraceae bacterium]|nr:hypothetical protein [Paracoccaceae bacterium]
MRVFAIAAVLTLAAGAAVEAGTIERACLKSDRTAANRALCGCIQDVADFTLSGTEQRLAAKFFKDPHMAQEIRQSDRQSHEVFWKKYKTFGRTAETYCG